MSFWGRGTRVVNGRALAVVLWAIALAATLAPAAPALASSYGVASWGQNTSRQLGDGTTNARSTTPVPVSELSGATAIAAGGRHGLALLGGGTVVAWGANESGQLGNGTNTTSNVPVTVSGLSGVSAIAAGAEHSLALSSGGTVMAWGGNEDGQLGNGSTAGESKVPVAVKNLSGVTEIAAGANHSLALLGNGTVMAWGSNESGQLGTGNLKSSTVPVAVKSLSGVTAISAGNGYSIALLGDGTVMAWGDNLEGELGNASVEEHSTLPVPVSELSGVSAISASGGHSLALLSDGTVKAWGENRYGQLGNGTAGASRVTPVTVSGLSEVTAIAAGRSHSLALLSGRTVKAWGQNLFGQLGNGITSEVNDLPLAVSGLGEVAGISAGEGFSLAYGAPLPSLSGVSPASGPMAGGTSVTISGANLAAASAVTFGTVPAASFTVNSANSITATSPAGKGAVDVTVTTTAGISRTAAVDRFTYVPPPEVKKLSPNHGPTTGGTSVTITGANFTGATAVSFGSVPAASYTVSSATSITAVAPAETEGTVDVRVTTPYGTSVIKTSDHFKYTPTVTSVSPNHGSTAGGTQVTITGTGFATGTIATIIKFGTKRGTSVKCVSSTECTAVAPAHEAGIVDVQATVSKVASPKTPEDRFTYE